MVLKPEKEKEAEAIFRKWGLDFAVVGYTTPSKRFVVKHGGVAMADLPIKELGDEAPIYDRPHVETPKLPVIHARDVAAPLASGPTMLLPHSQKFVGGHVAFYRQEFIDHFTAHRVQVPLRSGDAVFFNPALFHGAGANTSADISRMANLLQISSPFGRAMESLDRTAMVRAVYPALLAMTAAGRPKRDIANAVNATAEGYPFPTNLDSDQPIGSLAPPSQVDTVLAALAGGLTAAALEAALDAQQIRRMP